jgi:serine/threonine-protein kinase
MSGAESGDTGKIVGRYVLHKRIAAGGMASVHFGRLLGEVGFTRVVAIKRLHAQFASDPDFAAMFLDEARLAARIHHPNVAGTLDVVAADDELFLVMEYVPGEALQKLFRAAVAKGSPPPAAHAVAIMVGTLHGLHAAHEARNAAGEWLGIVHRDVSPHNILVGEDGVARLIDFGVAKAIERIHSTRDGGLRGKIGYMAPEQLTGDRVDRRADVYAAAVVLWELLTGERYLDIGNPAAAVKVAVEREPQSPRRIVPALPVALDAVTLQGLAKKPADRFSTALEMATALERALAPSTQREISQWVSELAGEALHERRQILRRIETAPDPSQGPVDYAPEAPDAEASWLPGDALKTEVSQVSQPSSVTMETPRTTRRALSQPPRRTASVVAGVLAGAVLGATLILVAIRPSRPVAPASITPAASASALVTPPTPSNTPAASASVDAPTIAFSALPLASSPRAAVQLVRPAAPAPAPASSARHPPLFSRD